MINNVTIKNYKSVVDVSLPLGRFNLLIGANGCGKSNILEGIALGAAASADKLDYEYFANRGIRVVEPRFMLPAFEDSEAEVISIAFSNGDNNVATFDIRHNKDLKPAQWQDDSVSADRFVTYVVENPPKQNPLINEMVDLLQKMKSDSPNPLANIRLKPINDKVSIMTVDQDLSRFIIYSPEESKLREPNNSNRLYPMGRHGEGLFAYLKELSQKNESANVFNEIKDNLRVLDWFDDMQVPSGQLSMEFDLKLKDSYLAETINTFDQRSTNEGFLYLLFYLTLVISDETPSFFAIENIDTAFNPKLCREVVRRLIELARKHDKQIIATTHNPAVLDGLDLSDDEQKLMVVQRSIDGYTKVRTLKNEQIVNSDLPLSQLWLRGFIGGLPNNF
jgi:predicted ATPase